MSEELSEHKMQRYLYLASEFQKDNPKKAFMYYKLSINAATGVINSCLSEMDICLYTIEDNQKGGEE